MANYAAVKESGRKADERLVVLKEVAQGKPKTPDNERRIPAGKGNRDGKNPPAAKD